MTPSQRVVVLGGGYAGVRAARDLGRFKKQNPQEADFEIILVNQDEYHYDVTAFYEVATTYLDLDSTNSSEIIRASVRAPLLDILGDLPLQFHFGQVKRISSDEKILYFADGKTLSWDIMVVGVGSAVATFGISGVAEYAYQVRTLTDSLRLRHHIVQQFKRYLKVEEEEQAAALTFVVAGGGPSGVETVAELVGHSKHQCSKQQIDPAAVQVFLIEAGHRILSSLPEKISLEATERLKKMGVKVLTGKRINQVKEDQVLFENGGKLSTRTTIWAAGLKPTDLLTGSGLPLKNWGLEVERSLQVKGRPDIFAVGDSAVITDYPQAIPATVPVAYSQGSLAARNVRRRLKGQKLEDYTYSSASGVLISVGPRYGIAMLPQGQVLSGLIPWLVKKFVTLRYWVTYLPFFQALKLWRRGLSMQGKND